MSYFDCQLTTNPHPHKQLTLLFVTLTAQPTSMAFNYSSGGTLYTLFVLGGVIERTTLQMFLIVFSVEVVGNYFYVHDCARCFQCFPDESGKKKME